MDNEKNAKNAKIFKCDSCDFICSKKSNFIKHTTTDKHKRITNGNSMVTKNAEQFTCEICSSVYKYKSGLCRHKKKCQTLNNTIECSENSIIPASMIETDIKSLTNLVIEVVKSNSEFQKQIVDLVKNTNITNNTNCHNNNTFNLQLFLNEECKDAMNISDFVNSVNIQLEDLEDVGRLGYATGMSNIIVKELKMLDVYKRPIHCSDIKREIFYVKDNDVWEKETPENNKMKKAIKGISKKNMVKLNDWRDKHPDCLDSSSSYNDIYLNLMVESCGGRGDFSVGENKILKNIAKEVVIKK